MTTFYLICAFYAQFVNGIRAANLERKKSELNSITIIYSYSAKQDRILSGVLETIQHVVMTMSWRIRQPLNLYRLFIELEVRYIVQELSLWPVLF